MKSLVCFEDAEDDPELALYFRAKWGEVKEYFAKEVATIASQMLSIG